MEHRLWGRPLIVGLRTLVAFITLVSASALSQAIVSSAHPLYINRVYGFKVTLPSGLTYSRSIPPNPDHGFGIDLPADGKLWTDASYTDATSTEEEIQKQTEDCGIAERKPISLGGSRAISLRFSCPANAYHDAYQERLVLTVRRYKRRSPVIYQVGLRLGLKAESDRADKLLDQLVAGFAFDRVR